MIEIDDSAIAFRIGKMGTAQAFIISAVLAFVIGFADMLVESGISFSIFYLVPITAAVFLSGKRMGILFSFLCALVWFYSEYSGEYASRGIAVPIWNALVRLGYFSFHAALLSALLDTIREVKETAFRDPLTKAANWRYFEEYSNKLIKAAVRDRRTLALAYFDLDNFKQINDTLGHGVGDEVLMVVTRIAQECIRPRDLLARLGGDEFSLILDDADLPATKDILERVRAKVLEAMAEHEWQVTLSVGAMVFSVLPSTVGPMLKTVDDLMYQVKKNGKNGIKVVEQGGRG